CTHFDRRSKSVPDNIQCRSILIIPPGLPTAHACFTRHFLFCLSHRADAVQPFRMGLSKNETPELDNPAPHRILMGCVGNPLWIWILLSDRLALGGAGKTRL